VRVHKQKERLSCGSRIVDCEQQGGGGDQDHGTWSENPRKGGGETKENNSEEGKGSAAAKEFATKGCSGKRYGM